MPNKKSIITTPLFDKHYAERVRPFPKLQKAFLNALEVFEEDIKDPLLDTHELTGAMTGRFAIKANSDLRIVFKETEDKFIFSDIGTHEQVYLR